MPNKPIHEIRMGHVKADELCVAISKAPNLDRNFRLLRGKAGVGECVLHDLRRSAITNWAKKLPIQVVQQLAGHSDISMTRKYYLAVRAEDLASASKLLNKLLAKAKCD